MLRLPGPEDGLGLSRPAPRDAEPPALARAGIRRRKHQATAERPAGADDVKVIVTGASQQSFPKIAVQFEVKRSDGSFLLDASRDDFRVTEEGREVKSSISGAANDRGDRDDGRPGGRPQPEHGRRRSDRRTEAGGRLRFSRSCRRARGSRSSRLVPRSTGYCISRPTAARSERRSTRSSPPERRGFTTRLRWPRDARAGTGAPRGSGVDGRRRHVQSDRPVSNR